MSFLLNIMITNLIYLNKQYSGDIKAKSVYANLETKNYYCHLKHTLIHSDIHYLTEQSRVKKTA